MAGRLACKQARKANGRAKGLAGLLLWRVRGVVGSREVVMGWGEIKIMNASLSLITPPLYLACETYLLYCLFARSHSRGTLCNASHQLNFFLKHTNLDLLSGVCG